jgi:spore coat polysaccharide biosynthesis protein SpsF
MKKKVAIVQARMGSTRLPGKILKPLAGAPMIVRQLQRLLRSREIDEVCVAVPDAESSDAIEAALVELPVRIVRGDEHDVLSRYAVAAEECCADIVLRSTSDCPFLDPALADTLVSLRSKAEVPYVRTAMTRGFPHGYDLEVFTREALEQAAVEATELFEREHVTPFLWRNASRYPALHLDSFPNRRFIRLVVDFPDDYIFAEKLFGEMFCMNPEFSDQDLMTHLSQNWNLLELNRHLCEDWSAYQLEIK